MDDVELPIFLISFPCFKPFDDWDPNLMMNDLFINELMVDYSVVCDGELMI